MGFIGEQMTLLIGPTVAVPAPAVLTEALDNVSVTHNDSGRSGFQISFRTGRSGPADLVDHPLLSLPLLRPFNRVIIVVTMQAIPQVVMDGIISHQELSPSNDAGSSLLTITGEDVSVMMDMEEKHVEHPAQPEPVIALKLIAQYAQYGLIPMVIPPASMDVPIPIERTPVQYGTDFGYLNEMAARNGHVFYIIPGPAPFTNTAYWGPPVRAGLPQRALSINMGPASNVDSLNFGYNALAPERFTGKVQDRLSNQALPVETIASLRVPLASQPAHVAQGSNVRRKLFTDSGGMSAMQAYARAQGATDKSADDVITASGTLDAIRYGAILQARALVGLRGAGYSYDGFYYVKSVSHSIRPGAYKQQFTITREGVGSTTPAVIP